MTESHAREPHARESHYRRLLVMTVMSFIAMYVLMYAMVNSFENVYMNVNQFYMAGLIPHHAGAILMCRKAPIRDAEIKSLCEGIVSGQQAEIDQMTAMLRELTK